MTKDEALDLALEALERYVEEDEVAEGMPENEPWVETKRMGEKAITAIKQARSALVQSCYCPNCEALSKELAALKAQPTPVESVAVKHMMGWVETLKSQSDYGPHMRIPGLNAGACFELAIELEQFINTTPPAAQRQWVGLTEEEVAEGLRKPFWEDAARAIEAKLKEKNNG